MCWISTRGFSLECLFYASQETPDSDYPRTHGSAVPEFLSRTLLLQTSWETRVTTKIQYFDIWTGFERLLESLDRTVIFLL